MASKLSVGLILEDENFRQRLADDAKEVQSMGSQTSTANQSLAKMAQSLVNMTQKSSNYAKQTKQLTNTLIDMRANFSALSDAEKNSQFGKDLVRAMDEIEKKAASFRDIADDTRQSIKNMASDTAKWDAMKQGIDITKNSMQGLLSISALLGGKNEKLEQTIKKLAAVESVANTIISVGNALQKQSALMVGLRQAKEKALTLAIKARAIADASANKSLGAATVAQRLFSVAAKATPYGLVLGGITALVAGFSTLSNKMNESKDRYQEVTKKAEELSKKYDELKRKSDTTSNAISNSVGKYKALKMQFEALRTEGEKQQWLKDNISDIHQLNSSVNDLNSAYDYFIKNSAKVISAMTAIAKAAAAEELFKQAYPGIEVEVVAAGTGELAQRVVAEAANPQCDVFWGGGADTQFYNYGV